MIRLINENREIANIKEFDLPDLLNLLGFVL